MMMTEASAGLRKALARKAGVSKLTPEELLAEMTDEQKTALAASLAPASAPAAAASDDEDDDDMEEMEDGTKKPKSKKKDDKYMDDKAIAQAKAEERARFTTVMASEHYAGRETLATTLLGNDKLSADEIVAALAAAPKAAAPAPAASDADADDAADRAAMRDKLAAEQPAPTGQAAEDEPENDDILVTNMKARFERK